jgi:hypothetical protein
MEETTEQVTTKKASKTTTWLAILIGFAAIIVGSLDIIKDDATNSALVDMGVSMSVSNILVEYPDAAPTMLKVSQAIDAAIAARNGNTSDLITGLKSELNKITDESTATSATVVITRILAMVNDAHEKTQTEEACIKKLQVINESIKIALAK